MIDKRTLEQVVVEQHQELSAAGSKKLCQRKEENLINLDSNLAQVVIGVRRSGKSTLCYNVLKKSGVDFAYINFDDERLMGIDAANLNEMLEVLYKNRGDFKYLFLDEVQNVEGWHLFVNRLLRQGMHVIVTGSNAKLLSSELATHLTGRYEQVEVFPFSFAEFCEYKDIDTQSPTTAAEGQRRAAFDDYLRQGGFPELMHTRNKVNYLNTLTESILKRDIEQRYKIRYTNAFEQLSAHLLNIAPALVVESELTAMFKFKSTHTAGNYVNYLKQAYLLMAVKRYSAKSRLRMRNEKVYPVDVALMDARANAFAAENLGWRLETVVYVELRRRNGPLMRDVYYFRNANGHEADFVVCRGNTVEEIYQVCYDISNPKTRSREIRGLLAASAETGCNNLCLITDFQRETVEQGGKKIWIVPAYEWLLSAREIIQLFN